MPKAAKGSRSPFRNVALVSILFIWACGGLPANFETLSLEEKVVAYEAHLKVGFPLETARSHIAWHGWPAADLMAECLGGRRPDFPINEAVIIIRRVQLRGCSLQGTAAESSLEAYLATAPRDSAERLGAELALDAIKNNYFAGAATDGLPGGPCQENIENEQESE
jgi:hypothetical protein